MADSTAITEQIQRKVARLVATLPVGVGLCLIGGFRYRLLDHGIRRSVDIDYHWEGDLEAKQRELIDLFGRRLLPDVRRQLGLEGSVAAARGAAAESTAVAIVEPYHIVGDTAGGRARRMARCPAAASQHQVEVPITIQVPQGREEAVRARVLRAEIRVAVGERPLSVVQGQILLMAA